MIEKVLVYKVTDGQRTYIYEDAETALEHIRQGLMDVYQEEQEYILETARMTAAEIAALPVA